ncbi:MAG: aldo/keto reductase [Planctomycetes bacterium]|nr:aldo/keto reductase [Planctomycetota bacterium]
MVTRRLGRTGFAARPIGFGAFKLGRNQKAKYPAAYALPDDAEAARLLHGVLDLGVNWIDTAPAYGLSEERIGAALAGRRGEFFLSTKAGETFTDGVSRYDFSATALRASLESSLRRLRTDAVDALLLHSDGRDVEFGGAAEAQETLAALKREGKTRAIGLSAKTVEGARAALAWADLLMLEYHPAETACEGVLAEALRRDVGILVKKGLGAGSLAAATALPWILRNPAVGCVVVGTLDLAHLRADLALADAAAPAARLDR